MKLTRLEIEKRKVKLGYYVKRWSWGYLNDLGFFIIWLFSMSVVLIAIVGDAAEKAKIFDNFFDIASFIVTVYAIVGSLLLFVGLFYVSVLIIDFIRLQIRINRIRGNSRKNK